MRYFEKMGWGLAMFLLGAILGVLVAPIKKGVNVHIMSHNHGVEPWNSCADEDYEDCEEWELEDDEDLPF